MIFTSVFIFESRTALETKPHLRISKTFKSNSLLKRQLKMMSASLVDGVKGGRPVCRAGGPLNVKRSCVLSKSREWV